MATASGPSDTASEFNDDGRFIRAQDSLWRQFADVTLVRTVGNPEVVELWGTGALLWTVLIEPVSVNELASDLASVVDAPLDVVTRDVHNALTELVRRGLVMQLEST